MNKSEKIDRIMNVKILITHGGIFHADDVMSTALLVITKSICDHNLSLLVGKSPNVKTSFFTEYREEKEWMTDVYKKYMSSIYPDLGNKPPLVIRTNNVDAVIDAIVENGCDKNDIIVYDIGYGEFDHHQKNAAVRDNDVKYAAFGLLFREFGEILFSNTDDRNVFDKSVCQPIDMADNECGKNMLTSFINAFRPTWYEHCSMDYAFLKAYNIAYTYICQTMKQMLATRKAITELEQAFVCETDGGKILLLDEYMPHNDWCYKNGISAAIYPSNRGGYACSVISVPGGDNTCRFPISWRGLTSSDLVAKTRIDGMRFCHNSGFMISADTQIECIEATNYLEPYTPNITEK